MKEVIYPKPQEPAYDARLCPNCKEKKLVWGSISCPDGKPGCLVMHYGFTCDNCGKVYQ